MSPHTLLSFVGDFGSLEWRQAVMLHILVGEICISFFLFYCEGMLSLVVLWLCVKTNKK